MSTTLLQRIQRKSLRNLIIKPEDTIKFFKDGMTLGWSGFTPAGYPKIIPTTLADHVQKNKLEGSLKFNLVVGASVGAETADRWAELNMVHSYLPFQSGKHMNKSINNGSIHFKDIHLSNFANALAYGHYKTPVDIAVIEATEILPNGGVVLGASGGIAQEVCDVAKHVLIEVNTSLPSYKDLHDVVPDHPPPYRHPFLIQRVDDKIGKPYVYVDPEKIIGVVESTMPDNGRPLGPPDATSNKIAEHIVEFFENEVRNNRLPRNLLPLQSGVGNIANAVIAGLSNSDFAGVNMWTEVLQDTVLDWFDTGKLDHVTTTAVSLSVPGFQRFYKDWDHYADKITIRPQAISNHPEIIRRLGIIAMNTPVEVDMYMHVNSTHIAGSKVINGIGGSGDFLRNAYLSIIHTPSTRKTKTDPTGISCIVPMATHVDHTEHDVLVVVTEQGLADCRKLDPRQRARLIINNCAHEDYRPQLLEYLRMAEIECAKTNSLHQPHILSKAFKMHENFQNNGTMKLDSWD